MSQMGQSAKKRSNKQFSIAIALFVIAIFIVVGIPLYINSRPPGLDQTTLCPKNGPLGHVVLLVDKTDPLNFIQKKAFKERLKDFVEEQTPEGYLLSVFVLDEDFKATAEPLIELCNPGTGSDKSEFTANLKKLKRQYKERFLDPLLNQADNLIAAQPVKTSPIFEMIQLVNINAFHKHNVKGKRRLIIISDMLHNTSQFNMYKDQLDFDALIASDYGCKIQLDLQGVDVELHYLMHTPNLQNKRNLKFWEDYFNKAGSRIVVVRPLEG